MANGTQNGRGRGTGWRLMVAAAVLLSGLAGLDRAAPARGAAVVNDPPIQGAAAVFPQSDSVEIVNLSNYQPVTVRVIRNNAVVATAAGRTDLFGIFTVNRPPNPLLNHPYPPVNCWDGVTPNLRPGDVVRYTVNGADHQTTPAILSAGSPFLDPDGVLTVQGTARMANDQRPALASLELFLSRVGQNQQFTGTALPREMRARDGQLGRPDEVAAEGTLAYDGPESNAWTARFPGINEVDRERALLPTTETELFWLGRDPGAAVEETVYEVGATAGTAGFCAVNASGAITDVDRDVVNVATAGLPLEVAGVASDVVGSVRVGLEQEGISVGQTVEVDVPADGISDDRHPWRATVPASEVAKLSENGFKVVATFVPTNVDSTPSTHARGGMLKDTLAPKPPTTTRPAGTYREAIALNLQAEPLAKRYYTRDGTVPTVQSLRFGNTSNPIVFATSGTLKAVAFDGAGNRSEVSSFDYVIDSAGPRVVAVSPKRNARNVADGANVTVKLNEAVKGASNRTVQLKTGRTRVAARVTVSADGKTIVLNPSKALAAGTRYTISLTNGIKDASGNALAGQSWAFTTKGARR